MTLPNFLIIGAARGGTTSLHYLLSQHSDVYMSPIKEPGFFWAYGDPNPLRGPGAELMRHRLVNDLDKYEQLFQGATTQKALGESSARYLCHPTSPELIHRFIPAVRLVAILRQPAERAFSSYARNLRDGTEPCKDFAEALAQERQGLRDDWTYGRYLDKGFYYAGLKRYLEYFDRSQLNISLFEDFQRDPAAIIRSICGFLEIERDFKFDTDMPHNASGVIRNPALRFVWTHTSKLRAALRPLLSERARHRLSERVIRDVEKVRLDPVLRQDVTRIYRDDILQLQDLLQRDLSAWLNPVPVSQRPVPAIQIEP